MTNAGLPTLTHDRVELRLLIGCGIIFSIGGMIGWLAPQVVYGAMQRYDVGVGQAGLLTLEGLVMGSVTLLLGARPPRMPCRAVAAIALVLFVVTNLCSALAPSYGGLMAIRAVAGVSDGMLTFASVALIAIHSKAPDRSYAIMTIAMIVSGGLIVAGPPVLLPDLRGLSYLPLLGILGMLVAPALALLPRGKGPAAADAVDGVAPLPPAVRTRFAILMGFLVLSGFQAFVLFALSITLGERIGLDEPRLNGFLGIGLFVSVIGPLAVTTAVARMGHWRALMAAGVALLVVNLTVATTQSQPLFLAFLILNMVLFYFLIPLMLSFAADLDPSGRCSAIILGSITAVTSLSPSIAGEFVDLWGLRSLAYLVGATGALYLPLLVLLRPARPEPSPAHKSPAH